MGCAVLVLQFGEARDHAAAIAEHADRTALPVSLASLVRGFELPEQIDHIVFVLGQTFQTGHETRPLALFKLIQIRSVMQLFRHNVFLSVALRYVARRGLEFRFRTGSGTNHRPGFLMVKHVTVLQQA